MDILTLKSVASRYKKILFGQDVYFPIQHKCPTLSYGNHLNAWIVNPELIDKNSIVYSFGIGNEIDFDLELINKFGCKVHAFDPTPKSLNWLKTQNVPSKFIVHPVAIHHKDEDITFYPPENENHFSSSVVQKDETVSKSYTVPAKRVSTLMNELGHNHVDVLKMDIEGSEYQVVKDILSENLNIKQILIEIHHRFDYLDVSMTKKMIENLNQNGYKIFAISPMGQEYSLIKV